MTEKAVLARNLAWLPPPWEYVALRDGQETLVPVIRMELGLSQRSILAPPYQVIRPTLRTWLPEAFKTPAWWDWTAAGLIHRIFSLYELRQDEAVELEPAAMVAELARLSPARPEPLLLRIGRTGEPDEITYTVEVLDGLP